MSRWYTVQLTADIEVKVPDGEGPEGARAIAETLFTKRLATTSWGEGNPWTARLIGHGYVLGDPEPQEDEDVPCCEECAEDPNYGEDDD